MGWATIVGGGADGLYTISLDYGTATRTAQLAAMDARIADLTAQIEQDDVRIAELRENAVAIELSLQAMLLQIDIAQQANDGGLILLLKQQSDSAVVAYHEAQGQLAAVKVPRDLKDAERRNLRQRRAALAGARLSETKQAWCVGLTEDATGYGATLEVPGGDQTILLAPGARDPTEADGQLLAREIMSPEQAFWNAAVLPGWQKWKPLHRKGTITSIDNEANTASVSLDAATSSANGLPINQTSSLTGVPVQYMECNAAVFEVGDRVIVSFVGQNWEFPKVVGFLSNPKPCRFIYVGSPLDAPLSPGARPSGAYIKLGTAEYVDALLSFAGVSATCWLDGDGPFEMVPQLDGTEGGVRVDGLYTYYVGGRVRLNFSIFPPSYYASSSLSDQTKAQFPHGFLTFGTNWQIGEDHLSWGVAEVRIVIGGEKVLHIAYTALHPEYATSNAFRIKGIPVRPWIFNQQDISLLDDYVFRGS